MLQECWRPSAMFPHSWWKGLWCSALSSDVELFFSFLPSNERKNIKGDVFVCCSSRIIIIKGQCSNWSLRCQNLKCSQVRSCLACGAHLAAGEIRSSLHCPPVPPLGTMLPFLSLLAHSGTSWKSLPVQWRPVGGRDGAERGITLSLSS